MAVGPVNQIAGFRFRELHPESHIAKSCPGNNQPGLFVQDGLAGFPVELPVCPQCGFVYVPEELALGKVLSVEKALEDK